MAALRLSAGVNIDSVRVTDSDAEVLGGEALISRRRLCCATSPLDRACVRGGRLVKEEESESKCFGFFYLDDGSVFHHVAVDLLVFRLVLLLLQVGRVLKTNRQNKKETAMASSCAESDTQIHRDTLPFR